MGFLSGLFGGQKSTSNSQSGFSLLPSQIQNAYTNYATELSNQIPGAAQAYTPLPQTADETQAINTLRQGFAPTQESLASDISLLTNPYDDYVINDINRQATGDYSILKQALNEAGQFGSNRQMLGANDIERTRLNDIGRFRQDQYNNTINQIFSSLIPQRQQDVQGLLGIGEFERNLAGQTAQAPITALQQLATALGALPQSGGSTSTTTSTTKPNIFSSLFPQGVAGGSMPLPKGGA